MLLRLTEGFDAMSVAKELLYDHQTSAIYKLTQTLLFDTQEKSLALLGRVIWKGGWTFCLKVCVSRTICEALGTLPISRSITVRTVSYSDLLNLCT
jgi:hypothetical protein